jgi:biotin operon repressor
MTLTTDEVIQALENAYLTQMRPATLQEIADQLSVTPTAVAWHLKEAVSEGRVVKMNGSRGYMPLWVVRLVAEEGIKHASESVRATLENILSQPIPVAVVDRNGKSVGLRTSFDPTFEHSDRVDHGIVFAINHNLQLIGLEEAAGSYRIVVAPHVCGCGRRPFGSACWLCDCNKWRCVHCDDNHYCSVE